MKILVMSRRPHVADEVFDWPAVPRIGEIVRTPQMAARRVVDVYHQMPAGVITVVVE